MNTTVNISTKTFSPHTLPTANIEIALFDTSFILTANFIILSKHILNLSEKDTKIVIPMAVVNELKKIAASNNDLEKRTLAKKRLSYITSIKDYVSFPDAVVTSDMETSDRIILQETLHNIFFKPVAVFTNDNLLRDEIISAYKAIKNSKPKKPLYIIGGNEECNTLTRICEKKVCLKTEISESPRKVRDKAGNTYELIKDPIACGMDGKIFRIIGKPNFCVKIFNAKANTEKYNADIARLRDIIKISDRESEYGLKAALPLGFVYDDTDGHICGYIMEYFKETISLAELLEYGCFSLCNAQKNYCDIFEICENLCRLVHEFDQLGIYIHDMRLENILVDKTSNAVFIIDSDGWCVKGSDNKPGINSTILYPSSLKNEHDANVFRTLSLCISIILWGKNPYSSKGANTKEKIAEAVQNLDFPYKSEDTVVDGWSEALFFDRIPDNIRKKFTSMFTLSPDADFNLENWVKIFSDAKLSEHSYPKDDSVIYWEDVCDTDKCGGHNYEISWIMADADKK